MNAERDERLYEVFQPVRGCDPAERVTLLDGLCADDPELRAAVERLLAQDAEAERGGFLAPPAPSGRGEEGHRLDPFRRRRLDIDIVCPHCRKSWP
jgi:hypothetical protein